MPKLRVRIIIINIKYLNIMKFTLRKLLTIGLLFGASANAKYTEGMNPGIMVRLD